MYGIDKVKRINSEENKQNQKLLFYQKTNKTDKTLDLQKREHTSYQNHT